MLTPTRTDLRHASYGVVSTLLGMGAAHLLAGLTVPAASPVLAVGSTVIDLTPTPLKEWAIRQFGSADKIVLVGSVVVVVLLLAALAGILAGRRPTAGLLALVGLAAVAGALAATRPAAGPLDLLPALIAAVVGATALWWLTRLDDRASDGPPHGDGGPSRRGVVLATGGLAVGAVALGALGRWAASYRLGGTDVALPEATGPAPSFPRGLEERVPGITPLRTPTSDFYRVDTRLSLPVVDVDRVDPDDRRRRRPGGHAHLRRPRRDGCRRARHHPDLRLQPGRRRRTSAAPAGSAYPCATCSTRPASAAPGPTRSSPPTSTA